jgi:hypothetical protein
MLSNHTKLRGQLVEEFPRFDILPVNEKYVGAYRAHKGSAENKQDAPPTQRQVCPLDGEVEVFLFHIRALLAYRGVINRHSDGVNLVKDSEHSSLDVKVIGNTEGTHQDHATVLRTEISHVTLVQPIHIRNTLLR